MLNVRAVFSEALRQRAMNIFNRPRVSPVRGQLTKQFFGKGSAHSYATYRRFNNQVTSSNPLQDPFLKKVIGITLGLGTVIYVTNLDAAPVTGRKRFIITSERFEQWIGKQSYNQLMAEFRYTGKILPDNHPQAIRAKRIFQRILQASPVDESSLNWSLHVINDPTAPPNAFVLPGGKVFVFSTILPICENDDGLATVLSHEFAHQLARHTGENLSSAPIYGAISLTLYALTGADVFSRLIIDAVFKMPASREMETEADYIGLMLMAKACFDPREAPKLWNRMANWEKSSIISRMPELLSTHPASERRIENMKQWLPKAMSERENSHCSQFSDFMFSNGGFW